MNTSKTFVKTLILLCIGIVIIGCSTKPKPIQPKDKIKVGMDESNVSKILGLPELWQSGEDEKEEAWQYCLTERFKPVNDVIVVWFYESHVTGVDTYTNIGFGGCAMFFRTLKWENAPHRRKVR